MSNITVENISLDDERIAWVEAKPVGWAGTVSVDRFHDALRNAGVPEDLWPSEPTPNKCLERAVKDLAEDRRTLVRPLHKSKGWSLVYEDAEELDLENAVLGLNSVGTTSKHAHIVSLTARVKKVNDTPYVECTPWNHPLATKLSQSFSAWRGVFKCSQDLSMWFSQTIVPWCQGVATRARGGSYYIVKGEPLTNMRKIQAALEEVSSSFESVRYVGNTPIALTTIESGGRVLLKPEVASTVAVEILLENFISECDRVCDDVGAKLEDSTLGHRALNTQAKVANAQADKVKLVERLLDVKLDELRDRLGELESDAGVAALAALDED